MASKWVSVQRRAPAMHAVSAGAVFLASCVLLLMLWGCGSSSSISVALSSPASTVDAGSAGITITATVTHDSKNAGVNFSLSPSSGCGSIPASSTGTSVVYTPQPTATLNADCTATITATSVSSSSKSSTVTVTVKAITVTLVSPPTNTTLTAGASPITLTAALAHDTATDSVKWSISSGCGALAPSGTTAVYTPPSASLAQQCKATIAAGSTVNPNLSSSQTASIVFTVNPVQVSSLTIDTTSLPNGVLNSAYSQTLEASGGTTPYTWSVASGSSLPSWLALSPAGVLSGTPTAAGTSNFTVQVNDSTSPTEQSKTQALSVTVAASASACGTGSESVLSGQYAFSLSGYSGTSFLAAIGSFTANGSGNITGGMVDSNGALGPQSAAVTTGGSSYSVGNDYRGCATIVTPFKTFYTRFALDPVSHTIGNMEEWESGTAPFIGSGEILKQTIPSALTAGVWVYKQLGVYGSGATRLGVVGTITASGSGTYTAGEYDSNDVGVHHTYTGLSGTYGSVDQTTGRYTVVTSLDGISANRAEYMVSSSEFLELTTDPVSSFPVLIGKGLLQSGGLTLSGNLIYYASGMESNAAGSFVQFGRATVGGSNSVTANVYENDAGTWVTKTSSCSYAIDSYGQVTTSGANCGTYPPVFYLISPNKGFMLGTEPGVLIGELAPQSKTSITARNYCFGTGEVVNPAVATEVGDAMLTSTGGVTGTSDKTSVSSPQQGGKAITDTLTVNSDGTFSTLENPGVISGAVISDYQLILVDQQGSSYPTILVIDTIPEA